MGLIHVGFLNKNTILLEHYSFKKKLLYILKSRTFGKTWVLRKEEKEERKEERDSLNI